MTGSPTPLVADSDRGLPRSPAVVDILSVSVAGSTVCAQGVVTASTVDLLLAVVDHLTRGGRPACLDLTAVSRLDPTAARVLFTARADASAAGSHLTLIAPVYLRRHLTRHPASIAPAHGAARRGGTTTGPPRIANCSHAQRAYRPAHRTLEDVYEQYP